MKYALIAFAALYIAALAVIVAIVELAPLVPPGRVGP